MSKSPGIAPVDLAQVHEDTLRWLEQAVIGLNLCPFAKGPHVKGQIRMVVSEARDTDALFEQLLQELQALAEADPEQTETTILVHPLVLQDFAAYNDFLDIADAALRVLRLEGVLQIASFHPDYRFADSEQEVDNLTNRAPWPTLHLIREASIDRAVASFPDAEAIYGRNIETMRRLGFAGWRALLKP